MHEPKLWEIEYTNGECSSYTSIEMHGVLLREFQNIENGTVSSIKKISPIKPEPVWIMIYDPEHIEKFNGKNKITIKLLENICQSYLDNLYKENGKFSLTIQSIESNKVPDYVTKDEGLKKFFSEKSNNQYDKFKYLQILTNDCSREYFAIY